MISPNLSGIPSEWFRYIDSCPVLKGEYGNEFQALMEANRSAAKEEFQAFMTRIQNKGTNVKPSGEDLAYLSSHYNPRNMTRDEYRAFVDDLCRMGVLEESDKDHVSYGMNAGSWELTRIDPLAPTATITSNVPPEYSRFNSSFSSSGGNILDWASYLSTFEHFNTDSQSFEKTRSAILFDIMQDILNQMTAA